jgi:hypothetical protein
MTAAAKSVMAIVLTHLLITLLHGLAHGALQVNLRALDTIFVAVIVLFSPLLAGILVWIGQQRSGLILLSLSMFGSLLFGLYHHFLVISSDHVHSQPTTPWGTAFVLTAHGLLLTEVIGTYVGVHFLRFGRQNVNC